MSVARCAVVYGDGDNGGSGGDEHGLGSGGDVDKDGCTC